MTIVVVRTLLVALVSLTELALTRLPLRLPPPRSRTAPTTEKAKIALAMVDLWETNEDISVTEAALRKLGALAMKERNRKLIRIAGAIPILCDFLRNADPSVGLTPDQSLALQVLALLCRNVRNREEVRKCDGLRHCLRIVKVKEERDLIEDLKALKELAKNGTCSMHGVTTTVASSTHISFLRPIRVSRQEQGRVARGPLDRDGCADDLAAQPAHPGAGARSVVHHVDERRQEPGYRA